VHRRGFESFDFLGVNGGVVNRRGFESLKTIFLIKFFFGCS
jgi:hypothetical protein